MQVENNLTQTNSNTFHSQLWPTQKKSAIHLKCIQQDQPL